MLPPQDWLLLQVRRPDLTMWGQIPPGDVVSFECELLPLKVGTWKVTLGAESPAAQVLATPGYGLVITDSSGFILGTGPTGEAIEDRSADDPIGTYTITGEDDSVLFADRAAYPTPTTAAVEDGVQAGTDASGYDQRTGPAGSLIGAYTAANIGAGAPDPRKVPLLDVAADLALGASVSGEGRFQPLGELYEGLAQAGGPLGYRLAQQAGRLVLTPYVPRDLTAKVKLDLANGTLEKVTRTVSRPKITRAIVAGAGDDADRELIEVTTPESLAAEELWGYAGAPRRVERFVEASGSDDPDLLPQAGVEALADEGRTIVTVVIEPVDTPKVQFGRDYYLGDRISVVIGQDTVQDVVAGARVVWDADGLTRRAVLGDPSLAVRDQTLRALVTDRAKHQRRLGRLERS